MLLKRLFHRSLTRLAARWPQLSDSLVHSFYPRPGAATPWQPVTKPLDQSKIALVTTAGVHHRWQTPFDMADSNGDPSFRVIDNRTIEASYQITHDYYDRRDAQRDLNVVLPIARLKEMVEARCIGQVSTQHFSFMGHIDGSHVDRLIHESAPQVAALLKKECVDAVVLTPA